MRVLLTVLEAVKLRLTVTLGVTQEDWLPLGVPLLLPLCPPLMLAEKLTEVLLLEVALPD